MYSPLPCGMSNNRVNSIVTHLVISDRTDLRWNPEAGLLVLGETEMELLLEYNVD